MFDATAFRGSSGSRDRAGIINVCKNINAALGDDHLEMSGKLTGWFKT